MNYKNLVFQDIKPKMKICCKDARRRLGCGCLAFWIILFILVTLFFIYQAVAIVCHYLDYPTTTKTRMKSEKMMQFPSVTICNLGPVLDLKKNDIFTSPPQVADDAKRKVLWEDYYDATMDKKFAAGLQIAGLLKSCSFRGKPCSLNNFTHNFDSSLGSCFTFNAGFSRSDPASKSQTTAVIDVTRAGPMEGLKLSLNQQQAYNAMNGQGGSGVRVEVHADKSLPQPDTEGFTLSSGYSADVQVDKIVNKRVAAPFSNCRESVPDNYIQNITAIWPVAEYAKPSCAKVCKQKIYRDTCKCQDPMLIYSIVDLPSCTKGKFVECVRDVKKKAPEECGSTCSLPCNGVSFKPSISFNPLDQGSNNLMKLNVYYRTMDVTCMEQIAEMDLNRMLATICGVFMFWIGLPLLALVTYLVCTRKCVYELDDIDKVEPVMVTTGR